MKLLMIYAERFAFRPTMKTLEGAPDADPGCVGDAVLGLIHVEPADLEEGSKAVTKLVKNLKWLAGKNDTKTIVLHSFSHLSDEKAAPEPSYALFHRAQMRLQEAGYRVLQTPYGHFNDLELNAPGHPLARVFKSF